MARKQPIIRYGISLGIDTTDMARGARESNKVTRRLNRDLGQAKAANREYQHSLKTLTTALKEGAITKKEYNASLQKELERRNRLNGVTRARKIQMQKEAEAQRKLNKQKRDEERQSKKLEMQLNRENAARAKRAQMLGGGMAGGFSALGMGGPAAGAARFAGNFGAMGGMGLMHTGALGLGAAGAMGTFRVIKDSIDTYAQLESKLVDLKVLFGEEKGESLGKQFKNLAKNTALTTTQLVTNAKTWASYGLTAEGITKRLERLGTVAGGNSEKFKALTIAFAQVNAQGKLMGQEKNQLINAGFSLSEVAKVAGVEMTDFAKAMEDGAITAEHVNQALVNMTEEGGLFAGLLEEKAKTLEGQATILKSKWEEAYQSMGGESSYLVRYWNSASSALADYVKDFSDWAASTDSEGPVGMQHNLHSDRAMVKGGWGGSLAMEGTYLHGTMGGGLQTRDNKYANHRTERSYRLDLKRREMLADSDTRGMLGAASEERYAALRAEQERLYGKDFDMAPKEKTAAEKKAEAEAKAARDLQIKDFASFRKNYMFLDTSGGGYDENDKNKTLMGLREKMESGKWSSREYKMAVAIVENHFKKLQEADKAKEKKKKAEEAADLQKQRDQKADQLIGGIDGSNKYAGLTKGAQALLEKRDKKLEKIKNTEMAKGFSGGIAGGGKEYQLLGKIRSEQRDRTQQKQHNKKMEKMTERINKNTANQLKALHKQNKLLVPQNQGQAVP